MGSVEPFTLIAGPEAWTAAQYKDRSDWINVLSQQHIAELDAAIAEVERKGVPTAQIHVSVARVWGLLLLSACMSCAKLLQGLFERAHLVQ
jgi:hypothetical protein